MSSIPRPSGKSRRPRGRPYRGGPNLAAHAFGSGLVDECHLFLAPIVVGNGKRPFGQVRLELELLDEHRFRGGMVYLLTESRREGRLTLERARAATRLPAQDLDRARAFYSGEARTRTRRGARGGLLYRCGGSEFAFTSRRVRLQYHTQMGFEVEDIEAVVAEPAARGRLRGVRLPGLTTVNGIAEIEGNYPSKGKGERGAWFRDSEGNMLGLGQPVR